MFTVRFSLFVTALFLYNSHGGFAVNVGRNWAVLVAGTSGWKNYRHQANVCNVYQLLRSNGFPSDRIITFMYDDIAYHPNNPYPGKIFNDYSGIDRYDGVVVDYAGSDMNRENFIKVLNGDTVMKKYGYKVLESTADDNVFIYFSTFGFAGNLYMLNDVITRNELQDTLNSMHKEKRYNYLMFYVDASQSGMVFDKILPPDTGILAVTSCNSNEASWAFYCNDYTMNICLANIFSAIWIGDVRRHSVTTRSIERHIGNVRSDITQSHVEVYGDTSFASLPIGAFMAYNSYANDKSLNRKNVTNSEPVVERRNSKHNNYLLIRKCKQLVRLSFEKHCKSLYFDSRQTTSEQTYRRTFERLCTLATPTEELQLLVKKACQSSIHFSRGLW